MERIVREIKSLPVEQRVAVEAAVLRLVQKELAQKDSDIGRLFRDSPESMPHTKSLADAAVRNRWKTWQLPDFSQTKSTGETRNSAAESAVAKGPERNHGTEIDASAGSQGKESRDYRAVLKDWEDRRAQRPALDGDSQVSAVSFAASRDSQVSAASTAASLPPLVGERVNVTALSPPPSHHYPTAPQSAASSYQRPKPAPQRRASR
ncbi:hypothetical protein [Streptomyces sp. NPDC048277]|uniref:hypothetical protein n=1 Tax=Streptomyces sp. NPDC048277 TaxID=3155027 RepID=UPI0033F584BD